MGQDSWHAEQRRPYFLAKAGSAWAGWLQVSTTEMTTRAKENNEGASRNTLRIWERVETCMTGLLGKIESRSVLLSKRLLTKRPNTRILTDCGFVQKTSANANPSHFGQR